MERRSLIRRALITVAAISLLTPMAAHASFPGGNGLIAFTFEENACGEFCFGSAPQNGVWVVQPTTRKLRQVAAPAHALPTDVSGSVPASYVDQSFSGEPAFAPDGRHLAFTQQTWSVDPVSYDWAWARASLELTAPRGSGRRSVAIQDATHEPWPQYGDVGWTPDSSAAVFGNHLWRGVSYGVSEWNVAAGIESDTALPAVSFGPTGAVLDESESGVYAVWPDGRRKRVASGSFEDCDWSPNGRSLACIRPSSRECRWTGSDFGNLWVVPLSRGRSPRRVARGCLHGPAWSPDQRYIAVLRDPDEKDGVTTKLVVLRAVGRPRPRVTTACGPCWAAARPRETGDEYSGLTWQALPR